MNTEYLETRKKAMDILAKKVEILKQVTETFNLSNDDFSKWHTERLINSLKYTYNNSSFYKEKFEKAGITDTDFLNSSVLFKLPFLTRNEIKKQYPYGLLSSSIEDIVRYGESTGTTSEPVNSYFTREDWAENNSIVANFLSKIVSEKDIAGVVVPYELALVGQDLDRALEIIGTTTIAIGALTRFCPPERMVKIFKSAGVTVLICSPTRALYLADEVERLGLSPSKDFKISKILCVGEGISKARAEVLGKIWNAEIYPMYGMTESNTLAMPCQFGTLHLVESKAHFEIIDPISSNPKNYSSRGELVVTTFVKGMPLVRYRTGDLCTIHKNACRCGLSFNTLEHHGRLQDKITINNTDIQILDIEELVIGLSGTKYYTLQIDKNNVLNIGLVMSEEECLNVSFKIREAVKTKYNIEVNVRTVHSDKIHEVIKNSLKPSMLSTLIGNTETEVVRN